MSGGRVAEFIAAPGTYHRKPDVTLAMSEATWVSLYLSLATPEDLITRGAIGVRGDEAKAARLTSLFDRYRPEKAVVVPVTAYSRC